MNMITMLVALGSLLLQVMTVTPMGAAGSAANNGPAPDQHCASERPVTDPCGTSVLVSKGCVTLKYETVDEGPNKGEKCIAKVTVGSNDEAVVTVPDGAQVEVHVIGSGSVTVIAEGQGQVDGQNPEKSEPGIVISGTGAVASSGHLESVVQVKGNANVVQVSGKNHSLTITGDDNIVLHSGSNNPVVLNGDNNTVY